MGIFSRLFGGEKGQFSSPVDEARFHYEIAQQAKKKKNYRKAKEELERAIALDPHHQR